jgi:hypothetical protein
MECSQSRVENADHRAAAGEATTRNVATNHRTRSYSLFETTIPVTPLGRAGSIALTCVIAQHSKCRKRRKRRVEAPSSALGAIFSRQKTSSQQMKMVFSSSSSRKPGMAAIEMGGSRDRRRVSQPGAVRLMPKSSKPNGGQAGVGLRGGVLTAGACGVQAGGEAEWGSRRTDPMASALASGCRCQSSHRFTVLSGASYRCSRSAGPERWAPSGSRRAGVGAPGLARRQHTFGHDTSFPALRLAVA